ELDRFRVRPGVAPGPGRDRARRADRGAGPERVLAAHVLLADAVVRHAGASPKVSATRPAMCRPIASEAVAAGDGALRTWIASCETAIRKSSTSEPSGATACARTPAPPRTRSSVRSSGTSRWRARTKAALRRDRYISYVPVRQ